MPQYIEDYLDVAPQQEEASKGFFIEDLLGPAEQEKQKNPISQGMQSAAASVKDFVHTPTQTLVQKAGSAVKGIAEDVYEGGKAFLNAPTNEAVPQMAEGMGDIVLGTAKVGKDVASDFLKLIGLHGGNEAPSIIEDTITMRQKELQQLPQGSQVARGLGKVALEVAVGSKILPIKSSDSILKMAGKTGAVTALAQFVDPTFNEDAARQGNIVPEDTLSKEHLMKTGEAAALGTALGGAGGVAVDGIAAGGKYLGRNLNFIKGGSTATSKTAMRVRDKLIGQMENPASGQGNIIDAANKNLPVTTGQASGDIGLVAEEEAQRLLHRKVFARADVQNKQEMMKRIRAFDNAGSEQKAMDWATATDIERKSMFDAERSQLEEALSGNKTALEHEVAKLIDQGKLNDLIKSGVTVDDLLSTNVSSFYADIPDLVKTGGPENSRLTISRRINDVLGKKLDDATEMKNRLYKDALEKADLARAKVDTREVSTLAQKLAQDEAKAEDILGSTAKRFLLGEEGDSVHELTKLMDWKNRLDEEVSNLFSGAVPGKASNTIAAGTLKDIRNKLEEVIDNFVDDELKTNADFAVAWRGAEENYKDYASRFLNIDEGETTSTIRKWIEARSKRDLNPEEVAGKFFFTGGDAENKNIKSLMNAFRDRPQGEAVKFQLLKFAVRDLQKSLGDNPTVAKITTWANKHEGATTAIPELGNIVKNVRSSLGKRGQDVDTAKRVLGNFDNYVASELDRYSNDAIGTIIKRFGEGNPEQVVSDVVKKPNEFIELVETAQKDASGSAMEGLRELTQKTIRGKLIDASTIPGEEAVNFAKANTFFNPNSADRTWKTIKNSGIYTSDELQAWEDISSSILKASKSSKELGQATDNSQTASRIFDTAADASVVAAGRKAGPIHAFYRTLKKVYQGTVDRKFNKLYTEVLANPKLAYEILTAANMPAEVAAREVSQILTRIGALSGVKEDIDFDDVEETQAPATPVQAPPQKAIEKLRQDPSLAPYFNEKYGKGSAAQYLGR